MPVDRSTPPLDAWSIVDLEDALRAFSFDSDAALYVAKEFVGRRKGALHDVARLQVLATWARNATNPLLRYHSSNEKEAVLAELCDSAPGIVALRLCEGVSVGDKVVRRREALAPAAAKMNFTDALDWDRIIKGRTIDFTCVSGSKVQYLRPLFTARNARAVKRKGDMFQLLNSLSERVAQIDAERIPVRFIEACAVFASELMRNTQEHATSDHRSQPYLEHVEGLLCSWQQMLETEYVSDFKGNQRLIAFWNRERAQTGGAWGLRCLQLSFFDSGPGFAGRATGKSSTELSVAEERFALLRCLRKNESTKRVSGAGNGLPDVLEALRDVGGLISIRSGRLHLFNVFEPHEARDLYQFEDWSPRDLSPVAGAAVSLLIPIRR